MMHLYHTHGSQERLTTVRLEPVDGAGVALVGPAMLRCPICREVLRVEVKELAASWSASAPRSEP